MAVGIDFAEVYKNSELYRRNKAPIEELSTPAPGSEDLCFPSKYSRSFFIQCMACLSKQRWSYWRNPLYNAVRFLFIITISVLLGSMYYKVASKIETQQDLFNSMGFMYNASMLIGIKNCNSVQPVVGVERVVFYREKAAGMYSSLAYAVSQTMVEIPYNLVQAVVYGIIVYAMVGYEWSVTKVFWYIFFMFFTFLYFTYFGMMTAAMTPNAPLAALVSSSSNALWNLFSGFIVPRPRIPIWWRWYSWLNPVAWTLYALVASQFGDMKHSVDFNGRSVPVDDFLKIYFDFKHDFLGEVAAITVGFTVTFVLVFALSIKMFNFQRR